MRKAESFILLLIISMILFQAIEKQCCGIKHVGASPYNSDWDGTSLLVRMYNSFYGNTKIIDSWLSLYMTGKYDENSCNVLLIVSPEKRYTQIEKLIVHELVYGKGYNVVILDEGPHSNELLSYLNVPISIKNYNYIRDANGNPIVQGKVLLGNIPIQLYFAYVSPINIYDENICKPIAFINNTVVGGMCIKYNRRFLVIGDGSIVTNSVIEYESILNPYTTLSKYIISSVCNSNDNVIIFVDSSKYKVRLATISELVEQGYEPEEVLRILIIPTRYFFAFLLYINEFINENPALYLIPPTFILIIVLANELLFKEKNKPYTQLKLKENVHGDAIGKSLSDTINALCDILKEFKWNKEYEAVCRCLSSKFKKGTCVRELKYIIDSDKELRKYILQALSVAH